MSFEPNTQQGERDRIDALMKLIELPPVADRKVLAFSGNDGNCYPLLDVLEQMAKLITDLRKK